MFEDSLFASGVSLEQRRSAGRTRWIALTSVVLQGSIVGAFLAVPILWPETLPLVSVAPKVAMVAFEKPVVKVEPKPVRVTTATDETAVHAPSAPVVEARGGGVLRHSSSEVSASETAPSLYHGGMGNPSLATGLGFGADTGSGIEVVKASPKSTAPLRISSGVMQGMLIAPFHPVYPPIARMAHVEGTVVVTATIDKDGRIRNLQVASGPEMLRTAAIDAIKDARYKPYLLNGDPVEVVTTISVIFHLGS